jgi:hypothetical protein
MEGQKEVVMFESQVKKVCISAEFLVLHRNYTGYFATARKKYNI